MVGFLFGICRSPSTHVQLDFFVLAVSCGAALSLFGIQQSHHTRRSAALERVRLALLVTRWGGTEDVALPWLLGAPAHAVRGALSARKTHSVRDVGAGMARGGEVVGI